MQPSHLRIVPTLQLIINESNVADIQAEYDGPAGTPFEGGLFRMKLVLGPDFPNAPPKGTISRSQLLSLHPAHALYPISRLFATTERYLPLCP